MPHQELNGADIGSACPALFLSAPGLISSVHASSFSAGYHKQHF